jgi:hypothetical protein
MEYFGTALREHPELAIFLTLAVGFFVGSLRIGSFSLGPISARSGRPARARASAVIAPRRSAASPGETAEPAS